MFSSWQCPGWAWFRCFSGGAQCGGSSCQKPPHSAQWPLPHSFSILHAAPDASPGAVGPWPPSVRAACASLGSPAGCPTVPGTSPGTEFHDGRACLAGAVAHSTGSPRAWRPGVRWPTTFQGHQVDAGRSPCPPQLRVTVWSLCTKCVSYIKYPKACQQGESRALDRVLAREVLAEQQWPAGRPLHPHTSLPGPLGCPRGGSLSGHRLLAERLLQRPAESWLQPSEPCSSFCWRLSGAHRELPALDRSGVTDGAPACRRWAAQSVCLRSALCSAPAHPALAALCPAYFARRAQRRPPLPRPGPEAHSLDIPVLDKVPTRG